ncbi:hypothetical protein D0T51_00345 [Parabacteroides sp. 52]|uniref:winged helix-turn-helix domain-containing protein n=1 Tax=unclassified Parabacteroides TaxID=2649774 RepID=UPI0013D54281|nr:MULTISPECIES: winged helix-turn-helix domain-containing protein [unclassified Parabacteroides]MDH6533429.1 hypothetical protein [Parabacteroides sp. PM5-20]NDV54186.1 hypothetical protein [Parabacteroides sp. 52]
MIKHEVGQFAGAIWQLLVEREQMSIRKIGEITSLRESRIFLALGWLAREGKIQFRNQDGILYVKLIN